MTISSALRRRRVLRTRRPRLHQRITLLAVALLATAGGTASAPAVAQPLDVRSESVAVGSRHASEQSYTVPTSAQLPHLTRSAEVTVVAPPRPTWVLPAAGALRDGFGPRPNAPVVGVSGFHRGQDIGAPCGATIRAAAAGHVIEAGWNGNYGNWVLLQHPDGVQTGYAHAERLLVRVGQHVAAGTSIALTGSTGASSGCHLHFETRVHGKAVNPVPFMRSHEVRLGP
jgi:murein DD-endopeptidase MepM/ murein hydrolase activator NlpD